MSWVLGYILAKRYVKSLGIDQVKQDVETAKEVATLALTNIVRNINIRLLDGSIPFKKLAKKLDSETAVEVGAGATYTIPEGVWLVSLGANTRVEYSPDGGTTWRTLIPAGQGGLVVSDGKNVRLYNAGTASEISYLLQLE